MKYITLLYFSILSINLQAMESPTPSKEDSDYNVYQIYKQANEFSTSNQLQSKNLQDEEDDYSEIGAVVGLELFALIDKVNLMDKLKKFWN